MSFLNDFPHVRQYDGDLGWLIRQVQKLTGLYDRFDELPKLIQQAIIDYLDSDAFSDTLNALLAEWILSVKYPPNGLQPAAGDGATDDTATIQGCIDYAVAHGGASVYFPSGRYLSGPLTVSGDVGLHGDSRYTSVIVLKGGSLSALISGTAATLSICRIKLDGNGANQSRSLNVVDVGVGSMIVENAIITGGNRLLEAVADDIQVTDVIFDLAYSQAFNIECNRLQVQQAIINSVRRVDNDYCAFSITGDNALIDVTVSDQALDHLFDLNGDNAHIVIRGTSMTGYTDNGGGNSIAIVGHKQVIGGTDLQIATANPVRYGTPRPINGMFSGIDMIDDQGNPYMLLAAGNLDISNGLVSYQAFGGVADGVTDNTAKLRDFFEYIDTNHLIGYIEGGTYVLASGITYDVMHGIDILCDNRAVLKAGPDFPAQKLLQFRAVDPPDMLHFNWSGGYLIGENIPASASGQANDVMYVTLGKHSQRTIIEGVTISSLEAVTTRALTPADIPAGFAHTDSGLFITNNNAIIRGCNFYCFSDSGIYASGGGDTLDYHDITVTDCYFFGCAAGMTDKRQRRRSFIRSNTFEYCQIGYAQAEAGAAGQIYTGPADDLIITGNTFEHFHLGISARLSDGSVISNNRFYHFGDDSNPSYPTAIGLQGAVNTLISGNIIDMTDGVYTGFCRAVYATYRDTVDSKNTLMVGNQIVGKLPASGGHNARGVFFEGSRGGKVVSSGNSFTDVTTPFTNMDYVSGDYRTILGTTEEGYIYLGGTLITTYSEMKRKLDTIT